MLLGLRVCVFQHTPNQSGILWLIVETLLLRRFMVPARRLLGAVALAMSCTVPTSALVVTSLDKSVSVSVDPQTGAINSLTSRGTKHVVVGGTRPLHG